MIYVAENQRTTCTVIWHVRWSQVLGMEEIQVLKKQRRVGEDLTEWYWMVVPDRDKLHMVLSSLCLIFNYVVGSTQIERRAGKKLNRDLNLKSTADPQTFRVLGQNAFSDFFTSLRLICKTEITRLLFPQRDYLHNKSLSMHDSLLYICTASSIMRTWILGLQYKQYTTIKIVHPSKIYLMRLILRYLAGETWLYYTVNSASVTSAVPPFILLSHLQKALAEKWVLGKLSFMISCRWKERWTPKSEETCLELGSIAQRLCISAAASLWLHSPPAVSGQVCLEGSWFFSGKGKKASACSVLSILSLGRTTEHCRTAQALSFPSISR